MGTPFIDDTLGVAHNNIFLFNAVCVQKVDTGDTCGSCPIQHDLCLLDISLRDEAGIDKAGQGHNRSAMLVIVENWDWHELFKALFYQETIRSFDVLKVYTPEAGC